MQTIFNNLTDISTGISSYPEWRYLRAGLYRNLKTTIQYYQSRKFAVKGNHLLAKLLKSLSVSIDIDKERYYDIVDQKALNIGLHYKMSSSIYKGEVFDGIFYGNDVKEILIATNDYISPDKIEKDWRNIQSVKVIDHPKSDLSLLLPNGKSYSYESGYAVIEVNIPVLAMQYRCFLKEQYQRFLSDSTASPTSVFIHTYVLPNMMYSHLDISLFNRLYNRLVGAPMGKPLFRHAFTLIDYHDKVDKFLDSIISTLRRTDKDFNTILRMIPVVSELNLKSLLRLPQQAPTRQIAWVEFLARLKALEFLTYISPNYGKQLNRNELNYINRIIKLYTREGTFNQLKDIELYEDLTSRLKLLQIRIQ